MTAPTRDLLARRGTTILVYVVPTLAIVATAGEGIAAVVRTLV